VKLFDDRLARLGIGLQGVINILDVPLPPYCWDYLQLLVFAHTGSELWRNIKMEGENPFDNTSVQLAEDFMRRLGEKDYKLVYPTDHEGVDLIKIGRRLGWHNDSKLSIGINSKFGTWFAYRFVIAANTSFSETVLLETNPCDTCVNKPCISACPATAVTSGGFDLDRCVIERLTAHSDCAENCAARRACPVGSGYRYEMEHIRYHYRRSLASLRTYIQES